MTRPRTDSRARTAGAALLLAVAVVAAMLVATGALATGSNYGSVHRGNRTPIAVFSHAPKDLARISSARTLNPPPGAILAAVAGRNEVFALHQVAGDDCVMNLHMGAGGGSACASQAQAEERGVVGIFEEGAGATGAGSPATLRIAVMVPNGVGSIHFTRRDGSSYDVSVSDNVAVSEGLEIASVSYALPGGGSRTVNVAAVVDDAPQHPGAPGSSRTSPR
jgi:hypothetical protein